MWRSRTFCWFAVAYSLVLILAVVIVALLLMRRSEARVQEAIASSLLDKSILVREAVAHSHLDANHLQKRTQELGRETRTRITLIRAEGSVLADSASDPQGMANHRGRPEVEEAWTYGSGTAVRFSNTVRQDMLYVARRAEEGDVAIVRVAVPLGEVRSQAFPPWGIVWPAVGLGLGAVLCLSFALARLTTGPVHDLATRARHLLTDQDPQSVAPPQDDLDELAAGFVGLTAARVQLAADLAVARGRWDALLGSLEDGVVLVSHDRHVEYLNDVAMETLHLDAAKVRGRQFIEVLRHRPLADLIECTLTTATPRTIEIELPGRPRRFFKVKGIPLPGQFGAGALLVFRDVTRLRHLEGMRQELVTSVAHEFKTPLAAIQASTETLLDGALQDADVGGRFLERIRENSGRLIDLVEGLLALGRLEAGERVLAHRPVALRDVMAASQSRWVQHAETRQLRIALVPPEGDVVVLADQTALTEIIDQLVENAIRYTPAGGRVCLEWGVEDRMGVMRVRDTGMGMQASDLPRVFDRFYRANHDRNRTEGGAGLGLAIVKQLVEAMGGSISLSSRVEEGSTFCVRLPLAISARS